MARVKGITLERALEIAGDILVSAELQPNGDLVLIRNSELSEGTGVNVGRVAEKNVVFSENIITIGSIDKPYQEVCIPEWYSPKSQNAKLSNPGSLPTGNAKAVAWSPDGVYLAVAHVTSPYVTIYKRSGDIFTKLTNPSNLPAGNATSLAWSPNGKMLAVGHSTSPYITVYSRSGDTFTKLANPGTLPAGTVNGLVWSDDDSYLAVAMAASPWIVVYGFIADVFSSYYPASSYNNSAALAIAWDNYRLFATHSSSPYLNRYDFSGAALALSLVQPVDAPPATANAVALSPKKDYLVVAHNNAPYFTAYKNVVGALTKLTDIDGSLGNNSSACAWSPDGKYFVVGYSSSPYFSVFKRIEDRLVKVSDLAASLPAGSVIGANWSPDGSFLALAHDASPYVSIYKSSMAQPAGAPTRETL